MAKRKSVRSKRQNNKLKSVKKQNRVKSLLDSMQDGNEYGSIVDQFQDGDLLEEVIKGLQEIESLTGRTCLTYVGNVVRKDDGSSGVDPSDDLPFSEMLAKVPIKNKSVDIFLATRGGSAHQINRFVNSLRSRFEEVNFLIPSFCMSAGTLFALSGDEIFMTERACLGPIDPQVPTKDGRYVPAQALLLLVEKLKNEGLEALKNGSQVPWTAVRILDGIDKKELGDAITASEYSIQSATNFLVNYKFRNWDIRSSSKVKVTDEYRRTTAQYIAEELASHERWKNHGHAISRDVLWNEIKLKIKHPDNELERAIIRLWALFNWIFDKTNILKVITSKNYKFCRLSQNIN